MYNPDTAPLLASVATDEPVPDLPTPKPKSYVFRLRETGNGNKVAVI